MVKIYKFNEDFDFEDDYATWRKRLEEEEREKFKNRRRIGFRVGGAEEPKAIDNKSRQRYNLLNDKIKHQEDNIKKMKDGPDKEAETNQLNQMKRVRDKIKEENKFESLRYIKRFHESSKNSYEICWEDLPFSKWREDYSHKETVPFNKQDNKFIERLKEVFSNEEHNLKVSINEGEINLTPLRYKSTIEPMLSIYKFGDGIYVKKVSSMMRIIGDSYQERGREFKLYKTSNIFDLVKPGLF